MPKELIHFKIAQRTAALLKKTQFGPCIKTNPQKILLGAVFHDALFYGVTPSARPLERLAHKLHGAEGNDTFALLRLQASHVAKTKNKGISAAILVGMVSHVFADIIMHPMVWYFSGNYYTQNLKERTHVRQRHRALESLMDMIVCPEMIGNPYYSIRQILKYTKDEITSGIPLKSLAELAGIQQNKARDGIHSAWHIFANLQSLFPLKPLARTLFAIQPYLPRPATEIAALFYSPQLMRQASFLDKSIRFKHPVTGQKKTTTLEKLINAAATQASKLCFNLEKAVFNGEQLAPLPYGPSMDTGLAAISTKQMLHYASQPFPKFP